MARMFISLQHLDSWIEQGRAALDEDRLTVKRGDATGALREGAVFELKQAVFFAAVVGGTADPNQLLGRVKTKAQLDELGAEHYKDSVILGEAGYQVLEGFVGAPVS